MLNQKKMIKRKLQKEYMATLYFIDETEQNKITRKI